MRAATSRRRSDPERFDLYTRWSIYLFLACIPLIGLSVVAEVGAEAPAAAAAWGATVVAQVVVAVGVTAKALDRFLGGRRIPLAWLVGLGLATVAGAGIAAAGLPPTDGLAGRAGGTALSLGVALLALAPVLSTRAVVAAAVVVGLVVGAVVAVAPGVGESTVATFVSVTLIVGGMAASLRFSAWMLGVVWEQERSRTVHARLAVAEERLRFSRDLHDVVGRTLSAIAVMSELAAELARRGEDGAVEQMLQVRELAQESLREARSVVAGYRTADLAAELDGARSVLRSAGVSTRVLGEGTGLPEQVQQALGWVVREAVTNVVRHAHAGTCVIDLDVVTGPGGENLARLQITNDGVGRAPRRSGGSGLVGLAERLAAVGGELGTALDGDSFTLTATVPLAGPTWHDEEHHDPHPARRRRDPHP